MKNNRGLFRPLNYKITNQDGGKTAVIDIDGFIGQDLFLEWMTGEKSPNTVESLKKQLRSITADKIIVNINSPGGDMNDGFVIKDMLQAKRAQVITNLFGLSASAATAIHQGGDIRRMTRHSSFMLIHRSMIGLMGFYNQNSLRSLIDQQETLDRGLIALYASRSKATEQEIAELMDAGEGYGKYIDAETALEMGFIDEIFDPADEEDPHTDRMEGQEEPDPANKAEMLSGWGNIHMNGFTLAGNLLAGEPPTAAPGHEIANKNLNTDASASYAARERELELLKHK